MRTVTPLVLCSLAAAQTTWIVDDSGGPGVHFTSLPAAVAAAASGDTLRVAAGTYQAFHVANKALTILGAGATGPMATSITLPVSSGSLGPFAVYIATPPAGSTFRLAGVSISSPAGSPTIDTVLTVIGGAGSGNVVLSDLVCEGSTTGALRVHAIEVHASRCQFLGGVAPPQGFPLTLGRPAGRMTGNGRLVADACRFRAASVSGSAGAVGVVGGEGLVVDASRAWLFRSRLEGGDVSSSAGAGSTSGGTGLRVAASGRAWVFGTAVDRIAGGNASGFLMQNSGGAAIATDASSSVSVFGPIPLVGGSALPGTPGAVASGPNIVLGQPARPVTTMVGTAAAPDSGDLAGSQPVTLSLRGSPNQLALLFVHTIPSVLDLPGISDEPLLVDPTAFVVFAGALDGNGAYTFAFTPATQAPILLDVPLHLQGCVFDAASGLWLGSNAEIRRIR
jgi:hypothetical protein